LIRENNGVLDQTIIYEYDNGGNLQSKKEYAYTESTADLTGSERHTDSYLYENTNWLDQLMSYNGQTIEYDNLGNPISYNGYTYNWTFGDRLAGISGNGLETSYRYNDGGYRTQKEVNGVITTYTLEGSLVTHETNGVDEIYYTYDANGDLVSMNLNGEEYYYIKNIQGDMIGLYDQYGTKVVSYQYDTWGQLISIEGILADTVGEKNPYRYRGYRYDSETGLYYLNARYYNPEWGRFLNADSYGGSTGELLSHNVYAYVMNNPVNMYDPTGYWGVPNWLKNTFNFIIGDDVKTLTDGKLNWEDAGVVVSNIPIVRAAKAGKKALNFFKNNKGASKADVEVTIPSNRYPETSKHIQDAQKAGHPDTLTIDRSGAKLRRKDSLSGLDKVPGKDLDEYPPAMFKEGGMGASVRPVSPSDNRGAGAYLGNKLRNYPDGTKVRIK
ncbi:RHS repeat-associated core domain-containing protein, partial [Bacillaceae bacterium W0354]